MNAINDLKRNFYKDGTKNLHWGKVLSSFVAFIVLITFIIYNSSRLNRINKERAENRKYTIGVTGEIHHNIRSSKPTIEYQYSVSKKIYKGNQDIDAMYEKIVLPNGGRYYVEFSSNDPNNSKLLLGLPVPDTIQYCPETGWTTIKNYR